MEQLVRFCPNSQAGDKRCLGSERRPPIAGHVTAHMRQEVRRTATLGERLDRHLLNLGERLYELIDDKVFG